MSYSRLGTDIFESRKWGIEPDCIHVASFTNDLYNIDISVVVGAIGDYKFLLFFLFKSMLINWFLVLNVSAYQWQNDLNGYLKRTCPRDYDKVTAKVKRKMSKRQTTSYKTFCQKLYKTKSQIILGLYFLI